MVWTKAPFFFRKEFLASDGVDAERRAGEGEVKHLGDDAIIVSYRASGATVEVAAENYKRDLLLGPYLDPTRHTTTHT